MIKEIQDWKLNISDELYLKIEEEYENYDISPSKENMFKVFELIKFSEVKVVVLGQDPYPKKGDAQGIAFSVNRDYKLPPSLKNMYKELESDLKIVRKSGDLTDVVKQGVLFMNTVLTVRVSEAKSHSQLGWQKTTDQIIKDLSEVGDKIFVLLGADAQKIENKIDINKNVVLKTSHPSPLSAYRGFLGSKIYSKINDELDKNGEKRIKW